jgi:phosphoglycolate phosphatase-like HAD superfamily hydrolase
MDQHSNIQAMIFDIDGTLADSVPLIIAAFRKAVEPLVNRSLSDAEIKSTFGPDEEGSIRSIAPNDYKTGTKDFLEQYALLHTMCPRPFDGIEALLQLLQDRGVRLAIATGKGKYTTDLSLHHFGLTSYFEKIENGSSEGSRKIEAIGEILREFNVDKVHAAYIGDSASDITESKAAGVQGLAAAWASTANKEELENSKPDALFNSVEDLTTWLTARI